MLGIGNRWANRHTGGLDTYRRGRTFVHVDIEPTQIGRVFAPDYGIVSDARPRWQLFVEVARERAGSGATPDRYAWVEECAERKRTMQRTHPLRRRADQAAAGVRGDEPRRSAATPATSARSGCPRSPAAQFLHVYQPRHWINAGQAGPLGWTLPAALGVATADPDATVVALSGDYDFQFMIEELAVGAQFNLPYIHVVVNNSYLGLIRQSQRGVRHGLLRAAVVRQRQLPRAQRLRRRPRQGRRGPGLQGDARVRTRTRSPARSSRPRS